jgi:UTP--glucose-1-phosphate uridylyltransferase
MKKVRTAVIPVAGRGTRLLPLTKTTPKELLPVYDRPVIEHIVQEAQDAGIENIILVISDGKESLRHHFAENNAVICVYQDEPRGDGHAIAQAIPELEADEPVLVLFGDELIDNGKTGFLVDDDFEMVEKINLLISDDEVRNKMGRAARKFAEENDWGKYIDKLEKYLGEKL